MSASSGLTWLTMADSLSAAPDVQGSPVQFSNYQEAKNWAYWYLNYVKTSGAIYSAYILIYTTSDNDSGVYYLSGGNIIWTVFN